MSGYTVSGELGPAPGAVYPEVMQVFEPRSPRTGRCGLILLHGSGEVGWENLSAQPHSVILAAALAGAGISTIAGNFGGQAWGNNTLMDAIDDAWDVLIARFGVRSDKIALMGGSMGGWGVARYSQLHPEKTAAVVGLIPLWDPKSFYDAQHGAAAGAEIRSAWGIGAWPAALPDTADVMLNAELAADVPLLAGYSSVDTTVLPAWVTDYVDIVGGTATVIDSSAGHSDAAIGGMPIDTVGKFLARNGC